MNIVLFVLLVITVVLLIYFLSKELKTDKMNKSLAISMILLGILQLLIGFLKGTSRIPQKPRRSCFPGLLLTIF